MKEPKLIKKGMQFWQPVTLIGQDGNVDPGFLASVGLGKIPGVSYIRKFSFIPNLQSTTGERDVWEFGSTTWGNVNYDFPSDDTAPIDTVSSSDVSDSGLVVLQGLDINGAEVIQQLTLNGQNKVTIDTMLTVVTVV